MTSTDKSCIFVLNGPNINLLGTREPAIYGHRTLRELEAFCQAEAMAAGWEIRFEQTNAEHALVELVQRASQDGAAIVINPAAFSYSSYSLVDALRACDGPIVEVHLSNIHARDESWRAKSLVSPVASAVISGMGFDGYAAAIRWIATRHAQRTSESA